MHSVSIHFQQPPWLSGQKLPHAGGATPSPPPRRPSNATESAGVKPRPCKLARVEEKSWQYSFPSFSEFSHPPPPVEHERYLPIGLKLTITPSFLALVEETLARSLAESTTTRPCKKTRRGVNKDLARDKEKLKASNFPASLLKIGSWERRAVNVGDLIVKCYFAKQRLIWEILEDGLKRKIEMEWDDISAIRATSLENRCVLEVELDRQPHFFHEMDPQPRKYTQWLPATDFTGGQAMICRRHHVECPEGKLLKLYENLLECDSRLRELTTKPFPSASFPYFFAGRGGTEGHACNVDMPSIEIPSNLSHHLAYGSSNPTMHGLRNISCQQVQGPQSFTAMGADSNSRGWTTNQCLRCGPMFGATDPVLGAKCSPINCATRANMLPYIRKPLGAHAIHHLEGIRSKARSFTGEENLKSFYHVQNSARLRRLEAIEEHLMGDQEPSMYVDEQTVLARVISISSLLEENYQVTENNGQSSTCVDQQKVLARVRSMDPLHQRNYQAAEKNGQLTTEGHKVDSPKQSKGSNESTISVESIDL